MGAVALLTVLLFAAAAPAGAVRRVWTPELALPAALALFPDTPALRAAGVWYADYALAERVYGAPDVDSMTDRRIGRYFAAIAALRPGPETGAAQLAGGKWQQAYGYDLFAISSELYSRDRGTPEHVIAIAAGHMDLSYIAHVLATTGYTYTAIGRDRLFVQAPIPPQDTTRRAMNAVALTGGRLVAGAWPADVITATLRMQQHARTLGLDPGYRALANALGQVQGAYLAANVPPSPYESSPFTPPPGRRGRRLHHFTLYATAYQEPRPGRRYMEIALAYTRHADAAADVATLRARFARESVPVLDVTWTKISRVVSIAARGKVLLVRLRLRSSAPPTLWQDSVVEGGLSILSP